MSDHFAPKTPEWLTSGPVPVNGYEGLEPLADRPDGFVLDPSKVFAPESLSEHAVRQMHSPLDALLFSNGTLHSPRCPTRRFALDLVPVEVSLLRMLATSAPCQCFGGYAVETDWVEPVVTAALRPMLTRVGPSTGQGLDEMTQKLSVLATHAQSAAGRHLARELEPLAKAWLTEHSRLSRAYAAVHERDVIEHAVTLSAFHRQRRAGGRAMSSTEQHLVQLLLGDALNHGLHLEDAKRFTGGNPDLAALVEDFEAMNQERLRQEGTMDSPRIPGRAVVVAGNPGTVLEMNPYPIARDLIRRVETHYLVAPGTLVGPPQLASLALWWGTEVPSPLRHTNWSGVVEQDPSPAELETLRVMLHDGMMFDDALMASQHV